MFWFAFRGCDKAPCPKAPWAGKSLLPFKAYNHDGKSGQELWWGTWRQALMERPWRNPAYWLAPHGLLSLLSYTIQGHLLNSGITLQHQLSTKIPQDLPTGQSDGGNSSTDISSS